MRIDERQIAASVHEPHELLGHGNGDVEVPELPVVRFTGDELQDIGWSTRRMPCSRLAGAPCLITSVAMLKTRMNEPAAGSAAGGANRIVLGRSC